MSELPNIKSSLSFEVVTSGGTRLKARGLRDRTWPLQSWARIWCLATLFDIVYKIFGLLWWRN